MNNQNIRRVLIITYYWPPSGGSGVQRWLKFTKYLRDFGWEPVIYTPENPEYPAIDKSLEKDIPEGITILRQPITEPYAAYRKFTGRKKTDKLGAGFASETKQTSFTEKLSRWVRGNFFIPDARRFWIRPSVKYLNHWLSTNNVAAVVSSGPPHSMHMIALGVKKKFPALKWLADFRDPWTNIDFYDQLMLTGLADKKHHRMEASVLTYADVIVSVGHTMNEEFKELWKSKHPGQPLPDKFKVVHNGYDHADTAVHTAERDAKFSLAHIGTLNASRNPQVLWNVLQKLVADNADFAADFELKLVGQVDAEVRESITKAGLDKFLVKIDYLPHTEVMEVTNRSRVLLLLINRTRNAKGILTGKFFEYMSTGNPVLAIGPPDGDLAQILNETASGRISDFDDESALRNNLLELHRAYRAGTLTASAVSGAEAYSRRALTGKIAELLHV
ncbi:MAG: glycosyl transferase family 1 [Bacteroidia bacterium]